MPSMNDRFGSKAGVKGFSKELHPSRGDTGLTGIAKKFDSDPGFLRQKNRSISIASQRPGSRIEEEFPGC